jgi:simple sugar transport system permease protein
MESCYSHFPDGAFLRRIWESSFIYSVLVVLASFLLGAGLMLIYGADPLVAYKALLESAFGSVLGLSETMVKACPLILAGLGTAVAFRCKFWNIGSEGQIYIGGIMVTLVGTLPLPLPAIFHLPLAILAGFLGGAVYAFIPAFLKGKLKINEVITTLMLNYIAIHFVSFLVHGPMEDVNGYLPLSKKLLPAATLPVIIPRTRFHLGIVLAILASFLVYFLIWKTILGYRIRAVGLNEKAARVGGINPLSTLLWAGCISGGLSGLAGTMEIAGIQYRLMENFSPGYGFLAIAVALVGNLRPLGVIVASILFAALLSGSKAMQSTANVPATIIYVIEGFVIMIISARVLVRKLA